MTDLEPLFPSSVEMDRRCRAAKELRADYLRGLTRGVRRKLFPQKRSVVVLEASVVITLITIGVFWATLIGSPTATEAGTESGVSPEQLTVDPRLPSFEDAYRRHTGVLDTLN